MLSGVFFLVAAACVFVAALVAVVGLIKQLWELRRKDVGLCVFAFLLLIGGASLTASVIFRELGL